MSDEVAFWSKILEGIPLPIRRRASPYLSRVKRIAPLKWIVWRSNGAHYEVFREGDGIRCSCPYFQKEGVCKHIAAIAANELVRLDLLSAERT